MRITCDIHVGKIERSVLMPRTVHIVNLRLKSTIMMEPAPAYQDSSQMEQSALRSEVMESTKVKYNAMMETWITTMVVILTVKFRRNGNVLAKAQLFAPTL